MEFDLFTFSAQIVNFIVLVVLLRIFLYKRIIDAMDKREERIASRLQEAEAREKSAREDVWDMVGGMWFSTIVFLPLGVWLSYKAATDSALMSTETYSKLFSKFGLEKLTRKFSKKNEDTSGYQ